MNRTSRCLRSRVLVLSNTRNDSWNGASGCDVRCNVDFEVGLGRRHVVVDDVAIPDQLVIDQHLLEPVAEELSVPHHTGLVLPGSAKVIHRPHGIATETRLPVHGDVHCGWHRLMRPCVTRLTDGKRLSTLRMSTRLHHGSSALARKRRVREAQIDVVPAGTRRSRAALECERHREQCRSYFQYNLIHCASALARVWAYGLWPRASVRTADTTPSTTYRHAGVVKSSRCRPACDKRCYTINAMSVIMTAPGSVKLPIGTMVGKKSTPGTIFGRIVPNRPAVRCARHWACFHSHNHGHVVVGCLPHGCG